MAPAENRQSRPHLFGLDTLSPQDTELPCRHIGTFSELIVISNLLDQWRDMLSDIEYNGLLRVALRLRQHINHRCAVPDDAANRHWLSLIDNILDQAFITYPQPYANVSTYPSDSAEREGI